jgi:hypothetical protein
MVALNEHGEWLLYRKEGFMLTNDLDFRSKSRLRDLYEQHKLRVRRCLKRNYDEFGFLFRNFQGLKKRWLGYL